jgi:hypothetical protein
MKPSKKSANPFYALLIVVGVAFVVTAAAYGVMAVRESRSAAIAPGEVVAAHPLMTWMRENGNKALLIELGLLGLGTFGAIATDDYWQRRARRDNSSHPSQPR